MPKLGIKKISYYITSVLLCILIPRLPSQDAIKRVCVLSCFSSNPVDCSRQAPLSKGLSRQEFWSGLLCPLQGSPRPRVEPVSLWLLELAGGPLPLVPPGKPAVKWRGVKNRNLWFRHPGSRKFKIQAFVSKENLGTHTHTHTHTHTRIQGEEHLKRKAELRVMLLRANKVKVKVI